MNRTKRRPRSPIDEGGPGAGTVSQQHGFLEIVLESLTHPFYVIAAKDYTVRMANSAARLGPVTGTATCFALTHRNSRPCGSRDHPCPLEIVKQTKKPITVEHLHYDKDGQARNVEVHGFPVLDGAGNVVQMIEYCLDVTDRREAERALQQSEERYRSFVQNFEGIIYQETLDLLPVFFHGAVARITGYQESDFVAGRPRWDQVIHPDDLAAATDVVKAAQTRPGYAARHEYRIVRKDGQIRWVHELIQNVCDCAGKPSLMQGAIHDVTERKQMEEDLGKYRECLEEQVLARTMELSERNRQLLAEIERRRELERELLGIVERERQRIGQELHDSVGQQLTGIAFMMEVLGERLADKSCIQEAPYAEKINAHVGRAVELARSLAKGLHPIDLDRNGLLPALRELLADTEQLFNVSCTFTCGKAVSTLHTWVPIHLYRIAQEAITNAIRHGKAKNIKVKLIEQGDRVVLTVGSDGRAFPVGPGGAEGMGLKFMRYRAELMNGSLGIRRGSRGGTMVTCVLPKQGNSH